MHKDQTNNSYSRGIIREDWSRSSLGHRLCILKAPLSGRNNPSLRPTSPAEPSISPGSGSLDLVNAPPPAPILGLGNRPRDPGAWRVLPSDLPPAEAAQSGLLRPY